ncbi:MAG TPA: PKD domain-containing protein, partial [Acidimicrobiia bacterium]|nr:PKD domain-containing protein [Acidimicrobiia bacterium]
MRRYLQVCLAVSLTASALFVAPVATGAGSPLTLTPPAGQVTEGSPARFTARFEPAGSVAPERFSFAWGEGPVSVVAAPAAPPYTVSPTHTFTDEGTYQVRVQVTVPGALPMSRGTEVAVVNAAPVLAPLRDTVVPLRRQFRLLVAFADPGSADTHEVAVDWGDGVDDRQEGVTGGAALFTHRYAARRAYTVTVSVDDGDGGRDTAAFVARAVFTCGGLPVTIDAASAGPGPVVGTPGPDVIRGTPGPDIILGGGGPDTICGGGGADVLSGNAGDDTLIGGPGDDILQGNLGADFRAGGPGRDELWGSADGDVLHGGPGADRLYGGDGSDFLFRSEWPSLDQMDGGPGQNVVDTGKRGTEAG